MTGQRIGYVRVSTLDQSTARQLDGIDVDHTFEDKAYGKDANRPELERLDFPARVRANSAPATRR